MDATTRFDRRGGLLYPMMLIAAIALIVFSIVGVATLTGTLPRALSTPDSNIDRATPEAAVRGPGKSSEAGNVDEAAVESASAGDVRMGHGVPGRSETPRQRR